MEIRSATALCNDYDGEMPIELLEKREAELDLLTELLRRERSMLAGAKTAQAPSPATAVWWKSPSTTMYSAIKPFIFEEDLP